MLNSRLISRNIIQSKKIFLLPMPSISLSTLYTVYLFDLDGTLYLGDRLLPTVRETVLELMRLGQQLIFLTNDATHPRAHFARKLSRLGLPVAAEEIINSSYVMLAYLQQRLPGERLFVIGEPSLRHELRQAGFYLCDRPDHVAAVVVSTDFHFNYRKLKAAFDAIRSGALFVATNADRTYPLGDGGEEPDTGATIAAIETCTGHPLDVMVGKPSIYMAQIALRLAGVSPEHCLLVGDNLETDIRMGREAGMRTALVLTGVSHAEHLPASDIQPDYVIRQLADLLPQGGQDGATR
jgi:HAD superfamily hydrolase (TIGR01450 family)